MLKVIAVFKTDLFAKITNITPTLQIAFLLTWQGTPVVGFTSYNNYWKHRDGWNGWTDGWTDENTPVTERDRENIWSSLPDQFDSWIRKYLC